MKTRYEMTKLFSVERDFDGGLKVIAGNLTKTYNDLPIPTVSFLFGLSEYVARSAELFAKYVGPEREAEFSNRMLRTADCVEEEPDSFGPATHEVQVGGAEGVKRTSVAVTISQIESVFALAMKDSDRMFKAIIHDIAVKKLISVTK